MYGDVHVMINMMTLSLIHADNDYFFLPTCYQHYFSLKCVSFHSFYTTHVGDLMTFVNCIEEYSCLTVAHVWWYHMRINQRKILYHAMIRVGQ